MHFSFVDRVLPLQPGVSITTLKCISLGAEYLADHFPCFPVMRVRRQRVEAISPTSTLVAEREPEPELRGDKV